MYREIRARLAALGHVADWEWSQGLKPPESPLDFVVEYVWVVINSGMKNTVASKIFDRVWPWLRDGMVGDAPFGHRGKMGAIVFVYRNRHDYFASLASATDVVAWCETLPWIGSITKYHLAKNLGADVAKPDRWLVRLAEAEGETVDGLCRRLAAATGDRVATVDVVLWRACAIGLLVVNALGIELADTVP